MSPTLGNLTLKRGDDATRCNECGRTVPAAQPVLLVTEPSGEVLGLFHRFCYAGAERLGLERPGELDLTVAFIDNAERN